MTDNRPIQHVHGSRTDTLPELEEATFGYIKHLRLLKPGERVVVGVSGGADSTAMLRLLHGCAASERWQLVVAHLNHGMREAEGERDAVWVQALAAELGWPCEVALRPIEALARSWRQSVEESGRRVRYHWLARVARRVQANVVAVAHTADDQVETVLHRVIRGTGLHGLGGMEPVRSLVEGIRLVRPLLHTRRADIESWLRGHGHAWLEDPTNADERFTRNRIRHTLLPSLTRDFNPQMSQRLLDLAEQARAASGFFEKRAARQLRRLGRDNLQGGLQLPVAAVRRLPVPVRSELLCAAVVHITGHRRRFTYQHWQALDRLVTQPKSEATAELPGVKAFRRGDWLELEPTCVAVRQVA